jgi:cytochrome c oxidase assembly protein subunit 15
MFARPVAPIPRPRAIATWLMLVAAMVFMMVVIGGITRLTESGLSITRWEPISGAIPPFGAEAWQAQFDLYKDSPQFAQLGHGMTLADFKFIFFWEYVHRLLGRLIGLAFALPLAWFWWKRAIPSGFGWKLGAILALGALQGGIGWWMVASGLVDRPEVSHIRLAIHLITALVIFASMIWVALDLTARAKPPLLAIWALCALFLQFMFGAYVAGLDAGYAFNTWPKMGEDWYPAGADWMEPMLRNFADNPVTVQFVHRWLAFVVAGFALAIGLKAWLRGLRTEAAALIGAVTAQITLGILTILSGVQIDIAVTHQAMAVLLLAAMVTAAHRLGERPA